MIRFQDNIPPPISLSETLRALGLNQSCLMPGPVGSIRTLVSRVKTEFGGKRDFKTRATGKNVRVWRTR